MELIFQLTRLVNEGLVDEQYRRTGIGEGIGVLGRRPANVERGKRAAGPRHCEEQFDVSVGIEGQGRHERAVRYAEAAQRGGETRRPVAYLPPGTPAVAADGRRAVWSASYGLPQKLRSLHLR